MILITTVKMTLKQAERYFDMMKRGVMKTASKTQIAISLTRNLWQYVFTDKIAQIFNVPDKETMRRLMKARTFPPIGKYTEQYFRKMAREGRKPHGSLRENTFIDFDKDKVKFYIPREATTRTRTTKAGKTYTHNFGPEHEKNKSILKSTVVFAWYDILKRVVNVYKSFAERI